MRPGVAGVAERGHLTHTQRKTGPLGRQSVRRSLRVVAAVSVVWPVLVALTAAPAHAQADTTPPTLGATAGGVTTFGRVIGTDVHLYFSEAVDRDPGNLPVPDAFFIKVDGVSWSIRPGSVRGGAGSNELVLGDLSAPVVRGQTVSVAYVDSWLGDDVAAVQDLDGNDAAGFGFVTIDNGEENTTGRKLIMAFVSVERPPANPLLLHWALVPTSHGADSYDVQYARMSERPVPEAAWFDGPQNLTGTGAVHAYAGEGTATLENLDSATFYWMRVRGTNSHGAGEWAGPVGAWTNHARPASPRLVTGFVWVLGDGTELRMPFYRHLDRRAGRTPPKELFRVTAGGAPVTIGDVEIRENEPGSVYLTGLSPAIRKGRTVKVSFSYGANTIRDGVSLTPKRELRALALASEIMRLENLSGYLRFPGPLPVATIRLDYVDRPEAAARFVPRDGAGDDGPDKAAKAEPPLPKPDAGLPGAAPDRNAEMPDPQGALEFGPPPGEPEFWPPPRDDTVFDGAGKEPAAPDAGPPPPAEDTDAGATEDREDKAAARSGTQEDGGAEDDGAGSRPGVAI